MGRIISELIAGTNLFVPDAHDFFEVDVGGLPNGDDCLVVRGDLSQDYKAICHVGSFPGGIDMNYNSLNPGSVSMWLKMAATSDLGGTPTTANTMMAFMSRTSTLIGIVQEPLGSGSASVGLRMGASGTTGMSVTMGHQHKDGGTNRWYGSTVTLTPDTWHLAVFAFNPSSPRSEAALDLGAYGNGSAGSRTTAAGMNGNGSMFGIGAYSEDAGVQGRPGVWRLGKLTFHDRVLSTEERALLYNTMMGI